MLWADVWALCWMGAGGLFCGMWLYEKFRPRPIIARFVPEASDREDELLHRCIDLTNQVDAYHEIVADVELELTRLQGMVRMRTRLLGPERVEVE